MLSGRDCFIVGSGSSLCGFDFNKLDKHFTIGMNHIVEHYDKLNCLLFADRIFVKTTPYDLSKFQGMIFASEKATYQPEIETIKNNDNFYIFQDNRGHLSTDIEKDGLYHPTNSAIMAMNLALIMNAKKIYLLGFDYVDKKGNRHFYPDYEHHKRYPMIKFLKKLDKMLAFVPHRDRFINLNPESGLNLFKKQNRSTVL